jgi:hypothetical protein
MSEAKVNMAEFNRIKDLIQQAEAKALKAQGVIESIEKSWKSEYGISSYEEAQTKYAELEDKIDTFTKKQAKLIDELEGLQNWEKVEEALES